MEKGKVTVQGLIFDYGGTLDTNARHWAHVLWEGYQSEAIPITKQNFRDAYVHGERTLARHPIIMPQDDFRVLLLKKIDIETSFLSDNQYWQVDETERHEKNKRIAEYCYLYVRQQVERSRQTLLQLADTFPMVLVSNFYGNIHTILKDFCLDGFFSQVIESAVVGVRKPDPAIWQLGIDALQLPASSIAVIGDSFDKDILSARQLGCQTIWMKGEGWTDKEEDETIPTAIITKLSELLPLLHRA